MRTVAGLHREGAVVLSEPPVGSRILAWYDRARRELPWRYASGEVADPYRVWLSEVMLQQTTVRTVIPYFEAFVARWPTVESLAAAERDEVLSAWAGLGYYSRARNLHECAKAVTDRHGGKFPASEELLLGLPGIGPYTAAAVAAIAFGASATPVDGNIERVVARYFAVETPLPEAKLELHRLAATLTPVARAGDFAQGLMDLGATVCTPKRPSCMICPLSGGCRARAAGIAGRLPMRSPKPERPRRFGTAFLALSETGEVLLRRRPDDGLLAQMMEVPSTPWTDIATLEEAALRAAPVKADWWRVPASVRHTFTHFQLELTVYRAVVPAKAPLTLWSSPDRCRWVQRRALGREALPSVMRKVIAHGLESMS